MRSAIAPLVFVVCLAMLLSWSSTAVSAEKVDSAIRQLALLEVLDAAERIERVLSDARGSSASENQIERLAQLRLARAIQHATLLETAWGRQTSRAVLQAELDRVAREVPHRDLFADVLVALGHDIDLFAALVVKPQLELRELGQIHNNEAPDLLPFSVWLERKLEQTALRANESRRAVAGLPVELPDTLQVHSGLSLVDSTEPPPCDNWQTDGLFDKAKRRYDQFVVPPTPATWTGSQLVVLGDGASPLVYDLASRSWSSLVGFETELPLNGSITTWDGSELLVVGGRDTRYEIPVLALDTTATRTEVRRIDVQNGLRTDLSGGPRVDNAHGFWTGSELLIWGGYESLRVNFCDPTCPSYFCQFGCLCGDDCFRCEEPLLTSGFRYDPATETNSSLPPGALPIVEGQAVDWTGSELLVWGGVETDGTKVGVGEAFDPTTNMWRPITSVGAPAARERPTTAWSGTEWFVFGGLGDSFSRNDGGLYDPASDSWRAIPTSPLSARDAATVWTGTDFIVFGDGASSGWIFDPQQETWTAASSAGAPTVQFPGRWQGWWTGTYALFWDSESHTGGLYDPAADQWLPLVPTDPFAPASTSGAAVVSTGAELLSWGGLPNHTSARYDYLSASWSPITTDAGVLSPRGFPASVWTGSELLVWGGNGLMDGGRYDPATDTWQPIAPGGPSGPNQSTFLGGVWTGSEFFVMAQNFPPGDDISTAAAYDPAANTWRSITTLMGACDKPLKLVWAGDKVFCTEGFEQWVYRLEDSWQDVTHSPNAVLSDAIWNGSRVVSWASRQKQYDPIQNQWQAGPLIGAGNGESIAAWIGQRLLMIGGRVTENFNECSSTEPVPTRAWDFPGFPVERLSASPLQTPSHAFTIGGRVLVWEQSAARGAWLSHFTAFDDVSGLNVDGKQNTTVTWDASVGTDLRYEIVGGALSSIKTDLGLDSATCRQENYSGTAWVDTSPAPAPGDGIFYLVRARTPCARGDWGDADVPRTTINELCNS